MARETITSRKNPLVQRARAVRDGRDRSHLFIEGLRLSEEVLRAGLGCELVFHARSFTDEERGARLVENLKRAGAHIMPVSDAVLESLSDTVTSQGVVVIAERPACGRDALEAAPISNRPIVIMHRVNNPSNAGAMLRVAEAAGASAAISTEGSTDLLSPKALRGAMGSAFRLPLWMGATLSEALEWCASRDVLPVAADGGAARLHTELDWTVRRAIVVGPEARGFEPGEIEEIGESVRIPMREDVESLNVSVALAVLLYEAARQRGFD